MRLNSRPVIIAAVVLGIAFVALAFVYWIEPAKSLPSWLPGHETGSNHHHVKHGIASLLLGVALLIFAWFQSGPRRDRAAA
jgi:ammonia channel protein AmtB